MADLIQIRRDTAANWISVDPTLGLGEIGFVCTGSGNNTTMTNPIEFKVGDGTHSWTALPLQKASSIDEIVVNGVHYTTSGDNRTIDINVQVSGSATSGNFVAVSEEGGIVDSGQSPSDFVAASAVVGVTGSNPENIMNQKAVTDTVNSVTASILSVSASISSSIGSFSSSFASELDNYSGSFSASIAGLNSSLNAATSSLSASIANVASSGSALSSSFESFASEYEDYSASVSDTLDNKADIDGYYSSLTVGTAEDLVGNAGRIVSSWKPYIRTTAGDLDINDDEAVRLISLRAVTGPDCLPFSASSIRFNGFNALIASQVINNATIKQGKIKEGTNKVAYFRCVKCAWGGYQSSTENNGYLFTSSSLEQIEPIGVFLANSSSIPATGTLINLVPSESAGTPPHTYYLPSESGYLCVEFPSSQDLSKVCAHLAWDSERDDEFELRESSDVNIKSFFASSARLGVFEGMYGIGDGEDVIYDEIVFGKNIEGEEVEGTGSWYRRCGRRYLSELTWTSSSYIDEDNVKYTVYLGSISTVTTYKMLHNSPFICNLDGATVEDDKVKVVLENAPETYAGFIEYLGTSSIVYGLNTIASGNYVVKATSPGWDMGTEEFLDATGTNATLICSYVQGLRDYLVGLPSDLNVTDKVVAQTLNSLKGEVDELRTVVGMLQAFVHNNMVPGASIFLEGYGDPDIVPDTIWQFYMDMSGSKAVWVSVDNDLSGSNNWKKITTE